MNLYNKYILPKVIDWTCSQKPNQKQRAKIVPQAYGHVLEIGIGSGLNLPFYSIEKVKSLTGLDPSMPIWKKAKYDPNALKFKFEFVQGISEDIPADNNSFDCIVITYTLCSIPNFSKALAEIRRVLKPKGTLLFCEHGKAPDKNIQFWQNNINPLWKMVGGGCNLNRDIPKIIESNGLKLKTLETMYIPGWKPASFNYWGSAETY